MTYFELGAIRDQRVFIDAEWRRTQLTSRACACCSAICDSDSDPLPAIELDATESRTPRGPLVSVLRFCGMLTRCDLIADLKLVEAGCRLISLNLAGSQVDGYAVVLSPRQMWVPCYSDELCEVHPCRICGALCGGVDWENRWMKREDIDGRHVFFSLRNGSICVSEVGWSWIRPSTQKELVKEPLVIRG